MSLKSELIREGLAHPEDFDRHESDLYVRHSPALAKWLKDHGYRAEPFRVSKDHPDVGELWLDIPFMAD